jgi:hypothetical protein
MPQMGPILQGKSFFCPHCGALYAVTDARSRSRQLSDDVLLQFLIEEGVLEPGDFNGCPPGREPR